MAFITCSNDDDFSSDGNLPLTFSSDLISFDTIFSEIDSPTRKFKIYNKNNNSLIIQSIELMNPKKSGFRMNIDGENGSIISSVEILKKDSLFGFIEVTAPSSNSEIPILIKDSIKFTTNGNVQYLQLQAIGQDVYIWKGERITRDTLITKRKPLLIYDSIVIDNKATATIEAGVKIFMKNNATIEVHGSLKAEGSIEEPVIIRGERFDKFDNVIPYDNIPGQWGGIRFHPESYNNRLENTNIRNAERGITFYASNTKYKKATLINTSVQNTSEYGVLASNSNIDAINCLFSNSNGTLLTLNGGEYSFLHCTMANYFSWFSSFRTKESIIISNNSKIGKDTPLDKCDIINSIIYGTIKKELALDSTANTTFNYQFRSCIIKAEESTGPLFSNIIWNTDPSFLYLNNEGYYFYNFELKSPSPAIDKADRTYSERAPFDIKGRSRLSDTNPDIGCYEWIK
ncbi:hypothetical protein JGH11_01150 [Dysgonomonas sp. Marseille-P4677]|nr:choice-of-anchor Q domain-containing protein [Dysgonomonas sp. Marseille-P4677]MBK5719468.1 hypothetical protein [Dysgonomonas sp. Marseille-P4677]